MRAKRSNPVPLRPFWIASSLRSSQRYPSPGVVVHETWCKWPHRRNMASLRRFIFLDFRVKSGIIYPSLFGRWWSSAFRPTTPIFVARGPALLFGISRWLSQHGISRKRRNNLTRVLIAVERSTQESKANSSHPSSREGHRCAGLSPRQFGVRRSDCRRHFPCPAELGSITPHAMHNHGEPSCECDDGFFCPRRLAMFIAHAFSHDHFCPRVSMTCAAS